ncbi:acyl-CoA dehydrogenase family protein [Amycolatopsis sp. NPDC051071]|uniref:acyl-CoA dehydrogenase family protein n=1 Tax=Amycolatopsis sp. NPDC051071 TaxID=3154637 RepID=UPI00342190DD
MTETVVPTREELVERAAKVVPLLRERSLWIDEHGTMPDEVIEALEETDIFRMQVPVEYGGFESDARTLVDVHAELAKGNTSAAFCVAVYSLQNWMTALWPDEVLAEVFARPNVRVCGGGAPTGTATRVPGGYRVSGEWAFTSGVRHSHWKLSAAKTSGPDGEGGVFALLPVESLELRDDWDTVGLEGTGSVTTVAKDVFVPDKHILDAAEFMAKPCQSETNSTKGLYQVPIPVTATVAMVGVLLGSAEYALASFLERLPGRPISYTDYQSQAAASVTHLQVGEAAMLIEEALTRARQFADRMSEKTRDAEPWSQAERITSRVQIGRVGQLCKQAVEILASASGGSSIYRKVPIVRIHRDLHAMLLHGFFNPQTNIELYGRHLCDQEPNTTYF